MRVPSEAHLVAVAKPLRGGDGPPSDRHRHAATRLRKELTVVEGEEGGGLLPGQTGNLDVGFRSSEREREVGLLEAARAALLLHQARERHSASRQRTSSGGGIRLGETTRVWRESR